MNFQDLLGELLTMRVVQTCMTDVRTYAASEIILRRIAFLRDDEVAVSGQFLGGVVQHGQMRRLCVRERTETTRRGSKSDIFVWAHACSVLNLPSRR
jgi:hypothetical protein